MDLETYASTEIAYKNGFNKGYSKGYEDGVKDSNHWTPVTEGYPKKEGSYLCKYIFGQHSDIVFKQVLTYYANDKVPHFQHEGDALDMKVTHWMIIVD